MDHIDVKILALLEENGRMPLKAIAKEVYLSSPATAARIERLENEGVVTGYGAKLNLKVLGFPILAYINLAMHPSDKPTFYPFIAAQPNVLECHCVTGQYSQLIKVAFESTERLDSFINQLQRFGNTQTQIVFSTALPTRQIGIGALEEKL